MKRFIITIPYLLLFTFVNAQKPESKHEIALRNKIQKIANREFDNLNYAYAIPTFKAYLERVPKDTNSAIKLGYCYAINHQYDSALKYYLTAKSNGAHVQNKLGEIYAYLGDYANAVQAYAIQNERVKGFSYLKPLLIDSADYTIKNTILNSAYDEFAPVYYQKGLVFESNRAKRVNPRNEFAWNGSSFSNLYTIHQLDNITTDAVVRPIWWEKQIKTTFDDLTFETSNDNNTGSPRYDFNKGKYKNKKIKKFDAQFSSEFNTGAISFTKNQDVAFFTKNQENTNGVHQLEIWEVAKKDANTWDEPHRLAINNPSYSNFHPSVTADGKRLYFASDRPGGFGKTDIYYIEKSANNGWSEVVNMGSVVNTDQDELYPTINGNDLYYSSNGHVGLGGLDINKYNLKTKTNENVGFPINSNGDDFTYITENGKSGFISSSRYGSDDILHFDYEKKYLKIKGQTKLNNISKTIPLKLYLIDSLKGKNEFLDSLQSNKDGNFEFTVRPNRSYLIESIDKEITKKEIEVGQKDVVYDINLVYAIDTTEVIQPKANLYKFIAYYDLDKYNLTNAEKVVLDSLIQVLQDDSHLVATISSYTDCASTLKYNMELSKKRSKSVISYLTKHNINKNRLTEKNYGEDALVKNCRIKEYDEFDQVVNRRSEIIVRDTTEKDTQGTYLNDSQFKSIVTSLHTRVPVKKKKGKGYKSIWGKEDN